MNKLESLHEFIDRMTPDVPMSYYHTYSRSGDILTLTKWIYPRDVFAINKTPFIYEIRRTQLTINDKNQVTSSKEL